MTDIFSLFSVSYVFFIIDFGSTFYSVSNRIKFSIYTPGQKNPDTRIFSFIN
jgi:hypothetical protein